MNLCNIKKRGGDSLLFDNFCPSRSRLCPKRDPITHGGKNKAARLMSVGKNEKPGDLSSSLHHHSPGWSILMCKPKRAGFIPRPSDFKGQWKLFLIANWLRNFKAENQFQNWGVNCESLLIFSGDKNIKKYHTLKQHKLKRINRWYNSMDEIQKHYANWRKPDVRGCIIPFLEHSTKCKTRDGKLISGCQGLCGMGRDWP